MAESKNIRINIDESMPAGYEILSALEVKSGNGDGKASGVIELGPEEKEFERRVQSLDPLQMWGYDTPEWQAAWERYREDPDKWRMARDIAQLKNENAALREELTQQHKRMLKEIVSLRALIDERLPEQSAQPEPAPSSATETALPTDDEVVSTEEEALVEPEPTDPTLVVENEPEPNHVHVIPPEEAVVEAPPVWYERTRSRVIGGLAVAAVAVATLVVSGWNLHESEEIEQRQADDHGALKNIEQNTRSTQAAITNPGVVIEKNTEATKNAQGQGAPSPSSGGEAGAGNLSGYHTDFYNNNPKKRLTAVELPPKLKLKGKPGSEKIVDNAGNVVVKKVIWDSQGKLSKGTMNTIKNFKNGQYSVVAGHLGQRYKSIVTTS